MNINVFSKYRVEYTNNYAYREAYDEFKDDKAHWIQEMDASKLLDLIKSLVEDRNFMSISVYDDLISIEHFDPFSGEGADIEIKFKTVPEKDTENII